MGCCLRSYRAVFILVAAIGVLDRRRVSLAASVSFGVIIAAAWLSNLHPLTDYAKDRTLVDAEVRDALGAAQIAGPAGRPSFRPDAHHLPWLYLGEYLDAVRDLGSPAFSPEQIAAQPEDDRELADRVIVAAEGLALEQPGAGALRGAVPAPIGHSRGVLVGRTPIAGTGGGCTLPKPQSPQGAAIVTVTPAHGLYVSVRGIGGASIYVRRLAAHAPGRPLAVLSAGSPPALLPFPADSSTLP